MAPKRDRYGTLLDTIYTAAGDPTVWPEALTRASDYLGANGGMLIYHGPTPERCFTILGRLSEELAEVYWKHYALNPWTLAMRGVPFELPVSSNSLVDKSIIRRSGFYADVLQPSAIEDTLAVSLREMRINGGIGGFSFGLTERGTEQTVESLRRFSRLLPHLTRALSASLELGRHADGTRQLMSVLGLMPSPALLLDVEGRITYGNSGAEALLAMNDGLSVTREGSLNLAAAVPAETAALQRSIAEALSVAAGQESGLAGPLTLTRPSGRAPLIVIPIPLPPPAFTIWEMVESVRALVLVIDPESQPLSMAEGMQSAFGLTGAEARVAAFVAGGLSGPQVAAALSISPETVKTHLARCFAKTGVHSKPGLVRLLGMLPRT
jgi:DNA-binding CsgD family transcriptional regulator